MCLICIELDRARMTSAAGRRALGEMREGLGAAHAKEVEAKLSRADTGAAEAKAAKAAPGPSDP